MFQTGGYFDTELPRFKPGDGWTALCGRGGGFVLVPTDVMIELVDAPPHSINEGGSNWIVRAPACPGDGVVLLRGALVNAAASSPDASAAQDGDAPTADGGDDEARTGAPITTWLEKATSPDDKAMTLTLGDRTLRLRVQPAPDPEHRKRGARPRFGRRHRSAGRVRKPLPDHLGR